MSHGNRSSRTDLPSRVHLESDPADEFDAATKGYVDTYGRRKYLRLEEIVAPGTADPDDAWVYAVDENGITTLNLVTDTGVVVQLGRDLVQNVYNDTGALIAAGTVVHVTGSS